MANLPESFRVSQQLVRISLQLCYLCPHDTRDGTLETCSKRIDTQICVLLWIKQSFSVQFSDTRRKIRTHKITSTERILFDINMRIVK